MLTQPHNPDEERKAKAKKDFRDNKPRTERTVPKKPREKR